MIATAVVSLSMLLIAVVVYVAAAVPLGCC